MGYGRFAMTNGGPLCDRVQHLGEDMFNMKFKTPLLLFVTVGFAAAAGCRLSPPKSVDEGDGGALLCSEDPTLDVDAGAGDDPDAGTTPIDNVVTAMSCSGTTGPAVTLNYVQPYAPSPDTKTRVDMTAATMSLADKTRQMQGTLFGDAFHTQFNDIQRSMDTIDLRGFKYRDASRGMNLGEDMDGATQNAAVVNGEHIGYSTVFPVSMARGAAFDLDLEYAIGEAIGDEMQAAKQTLLLAPCMNLLRHPYWGRAQETYGEDPFHVGRLATAMTIGVQQHIAANAKHFMAYDIEVSRDVNNSQLDEQTLRETYGRHFRMVVQDGGVASVMASYNKINGEKATANAHLLTDVLRTDFGFKGFVLSDWWAMKPMTIAATDSNLLKGYAVEAVHAGLDVELPWALCFGQLESIVQTGGGLTEADITVSAKRVLEQKLRFQADKKTGSVGVGAPITKYRSSIISCNGPHLALAEKAAIESMVLLKNGNNTLPIPSAVKKLAVVGATVSFATDNGGPIKTGGKINFATDIRTGDLGSSRAFYDPAKASSPFDGLCRAAGGTVNADKTSCDNSTGVTVTTATNTDSGDLSPVMAAAAAADFVVVMAGLTAQDEGEEYTKAADRDNGCNLANCLALDAKQKGVYANIQNTLIQQVAALGKPMVVVLEGGSVIDLPWLGSVPAVVMSWYAGQRVGPALAKLLWGQANFSGKLPFTWAKSVDQYDTWNGAGTTRFDYHAGYSWFDYKSREPLFPFGYGLSYTTFEYRNLQLGCSDMSKGAVLPVVVNVANTGTVAGDEVVMVWVSFGANAQRPAWVQRPAKELKGFARVHLAVGEEKQITIPVRLSDLDYFQADAAGSTSGKWVVESGDVQIMVGGSSTNFPQTKHVTVAGY
jgi:beta-glucosidase